MQIWSCAQVITVGYNKSQLQIILQSRDGTFKMGLSILWGEFLGKNIGHHPYSTIRASLFLPWSECCEHSDAAGPFPFDAAATRAPESPSLGATVFRPNHSGALGLALGFSDLFFAVPAHICSPKMDLDGSISTRIAFQELQLRTCSRHLENPSCGSSGELSRCGLQCISSPAEACSQSEMW